MIDVSHYTDSPEILDGRVKTLHPKIHGGILAVRGNETHEKDMQDNEIGMIDMVVLNLYPFEQTMKQGESFEKCVENIDIGGPAMLRAAAKNFQYVAVLTSPAQYQAVKEEFEQNKQSLGAQGLATTYDFRKQLASQAFNLSATYDSLISNYFLSQVAVAPPASSLPAVKKTTKVYTPELELKYGCNPNQKPATLCSVNGRDLPFSILNGTPGYINFLDAFNAWQLVKELREQVNLPAAASFKHVSPAGAAVAVPLTESEAKSYEIKLNPDESNQFSELELAYIRARQADPMSSFGDFIALSDKVDVKTAKRIKTDISDGCIAPDFDSEALEILKAKKGGRFIVIKMDATFTPGRDAVQDIEFREVFGICFSQKRNDCVINAAALSEVVTKNKSLSDEAKRDLVVGNIALKYTQSNSVGFAKNGQMIGVGAGQQSRVDCVKLSGKKARIWCLRQHPKVQGLKFKKGVKRQDRINARVRFIENDFNGKELEGFFALFEQRDEVQFLTDAEIAQFLSHIKGVSLVSDAFFPFRDNIDVAFNLKFKVEYVAQAGGSINDGSVIEACDEYGMVMAFTRQRLFHH